jgi:site-specific recombinase XerD
MDQLQTFGLWLKNQNYSESTIRNYLVDIHKYLSSGLDVTQYALSIESDPNYSRYLSSLKKYVAFSMDQGSLNHDPLKKTRIYTQSPDLDQLVSVYEKHLIKRNTPISTIRNYINDLNQYISWLSTQKIETQ